MVLHTLPHKQRILVIEFHLASQNRKKKKHVPVSSEELLLFKSQVTVPSLMKPRVLWRPSLIVGTALEVFFEA